MSVLESTIAPDAVSHRHTLLPCEIYQAWQAAYEDAEHAYRAWCAVGPDLKAEAYAVYRAASDREDAAAEHWLAM